MAKVLITDTLLNNLADSISAKTGESTPMTISEMTDAVDDLEIPVSQASKSYTVSASGNQTISPDTGYDAMGQVALTVPTSTPSVGDTSTGALIANISRDTSDKYFNIPAGFRDAAWSYRLLGVPNGSASPASTITGTGATVTTGTNTITLSKSVSNTPTVSAGYISSGTAGNSSVSLTASVTTKAATTINTSLTDQTIASGTYLTGTQTIKAVTVSGLNANTILSGTTVKIGDANDDDRIASVSGNVTFKTYYTGSGAPSSSLGSVGDIYLQTS